MAGAATREVRAGSGKQTSTSCHSNSAGGRGTGSSRSLVWMGQTGFAPAEALTRKILLGMEMLPRLRMAITRRGWLSPVEDGHHHRSSRGRGPETSRAHPHITRSYPPLANTSQPNPIWFPPVLAGGPMALVGGVKGLRRARQEPEQGACNT